MQNVSSTPQAVALIHGGNEVPSLFGKVKFYQKSDCAVVVADIDGLPKNATGFYGFHIHEGTSCSGNGFSKSGSHYNPTGTLHPSHTGDLPPLILCNGGARMAVTTDRFKVTDIIGRTVIIHDMPDDFNSQPSGNAGSKIACGIIEKR